MVLNVRSDQARTNHIADLPDGPCPRLRGSGRKIRLQVEDVVCLAHKLAQATPLEGDAQRFEKIVSVVGLELYELRLDLRRDEHHRRALLVCRFLEPLNHLVPLRQISVRHVGRIDHLLPREQPEALDLQLLLLVQLRVPRRLVRLEHRDDFLERPLLRVAVLLAVLHHFLEPFLRLGEVRQGQLEVDDLGVAHGVDRAVDVDHVLVVEASDHVDDGVALSDVSEELVAEALSGGRALHQAGDVDELEGGGNDLHAFVDFFQDLEPRIGNFDDSDVRFDGAKRIIGGLRSLGLRQRVEKRRLSDVRETDDGSFQTHVQDGAAAEGPPRLLQNGGPRRGEGRASELPSAVDDKGGDGIPGGQHRSEERTGETVHGMAGETSDGGGFANVKYEILGRMSGERVCVVGAGVFSFFRSKHQAA
mmetsp:Transcript_24982/g.57743  ORF Transcript_24982/g.57743 Transcript_24982/m.57743 type:complete len:419 (-) Transcript_24982:19-1275(-)